MPCRSDDALFPGFSLSHSVQLLFGEFSVNYGLVLLPLFSALLSGKLQRPGAEMTVVMVLFAMIFMVAWFHQTELADDSARQLISFGIFMSAFVRMFMGIDSAMVGGFKVALVGISLYLSLLSVYAFLATARGGTLGFEAKNIVGSQRFGFVYLVAFWLIYGQHARSKAAKAAHSSSTGISAVAPTPEGANVR